MPDFKTKIFHSAFCRSSDLFKWKEEANKNRFDKFECVAASDEIVTKNKKGGRKKVSERIKSTYWWQVRNGFEK